jgi:hypothetical protein
VLSACSSFHYCQASSEATWAAGKARPYVASSHRLMPWRLVLYPLLAQLLPFDHTSSDYNSVRKCTTYVNLMLKIQIAVRRTHLLSLNSIVMSITSSAILERTSNESACALQPSIQNCKPQGNLARLVSKFEVRQRSSKDDGSSSSSKQSWASCVSSTGARRFGISVDNGDATEVDVDALPARISSGQQHSDRSNGVGNHADQALSQRDSQILMATRTLISRQKSVAERRKAFENVAGASCCKLDCSSRPFCDCSLHARVMIAQLIFQ